MRALHDGAEAVCHPLAELHVNLQPMGKRIDYLSFICELSATDQESFENPVIPIEILNFKIRIRIIGIKDAKIN